MRVMRVWAGEDTFGAELVAVELSGSALSATGTAIRTEPCPYLLEYQLATTDGYVTRQLVVRTHGAGWQRALVLERTTAGVWSCTTESRGDLDRPSPGGDLSALKGALDCDLGLSPLTNSMPVLRHGLHVSGGPMDFLMAWVAVPELAVYPSPQRYTFIRQTPAARIVRYESRDSDFVADVGFDDQGLVLNYPGLARATDRSRE